MRRVLLGMIIGLVIAGFILVVVNVAFATSGNGVSVADLGGSAGILVAGVLVGGSYAWLFQSTPGSHIENLMSGLTLGIIAWVVLALNVFPWLMGSGPMWQVAAVADALPLLMAYLLQASVIGLAYGLVRKPLAKQLEPEKQIAAPQIATRVVIWGVAMPG